MIESPIKVFVGSRINNGMEEYRDAVGSAIKDLGRDDLHFQAIYSEDFPGQAGTPREVCLAALRECDIYLGIFGESSSAPVDEEFKEAKACNLICLVFWVRPNDWTGDLPEHLRLLNHWDKGDFIKPVSNPHDLQHQVDIALRNELSSYLFRYHDNLRREYGYVSLDSIGRDPLPITDVILPRFRPQKGWKAQPGEEGCLVDWEQLLKKIDGCLILGPSGAGKTTAMRQLTYDLAIQALSVEKTGSDSAGPSAQKRFLPVHVKLKSFGGSLRTHVRNIVSDLGFPSSRDVFDPKDDLVTLLLLDGFDEIDEDRDKANCLQDLTELMLNRQVKCVMTSRPLELLSDRFETVFDIEALTNREVGLVFRLCLGQERADKLLLKLEDKGILDSFRRPLLAHFAAVSQKDPDQSSGNLTRGGIYRKVFEYSLLRKWEAKDQFKPDGRWIRSLLDFLGWVGFTMVSRKVNYIDLNEVPIPELRNSTDWEKEAFKDKLVETLKGHYLLDWVNGKIEFTHFSFRDFFAATYLAKEKNIREWKKLSPSRSWQEAIVFLVGILPSEKSLDFLGQLVDSYSVRWLMWKANHALNQYIDYPYFIFKCLLETPCDSAELKDRFLDYFVGKQSYIYSRHKDWVSFRSPGPGDEYSRLCGWIGKMGTPKALEFLRSEPYGYPDSVFGLVQSGNVDLLLELLNDFTFGESRSSQANEYVLQALFDRSDKRIKQSINSILTGDNERAKANLLRALMIFTSREGDRDPGFLYRYDEQLVQNLVHYSLHAKTRSNRRMPIACFLNAEKIRILPPPVEDLLLKYLESEDEGVRGAVACHLHNSRSELSLEVLNEMVVKDSSLMVRLEALQSIKHRYDLRFAKNQVDVDFIGTLVRFIPENQFINDDSEYEKFGTTVVEFRKIPAVMEMDEGLVNDLSVLVIGARHSNFSCIRIWSLLALAEKIGATAVPYFIEALEKDPDVDVRKHGLTNLNNTLHSKAVPYFRMALNDPERELRSWALSIFSFLPQEARKELRGDLETLLDDPDTDIRYYAKDELRKIDPSE